LLLLFCLPHAPLTRISNPVDDSKPQVILLAYLYPPHWEIGSLRPFRFRKYLECMGYRCHVITASAQSEPCPAGVTVIADPLAEIWEGEATARLSFKGHVELVLRHLMFPGHIGLLWSRAAAAECRNIVKRNPTARFVIFSTYPPIGSLLAGLFACGKRTPWICDFRDPFDTLVPGASSWYVRAWSRFTEKRVFRKAAAVIANTEPAAAAWQQCYPWARQKLHPIYNGYDPEGSPRPRPIPARDHKLIVHAGTLYPGRNPNALIEGIGRLRHQGLPEAMRAKVLLLGSITKLNEANWTLYESAQREDWLELRATVPRSEAQAIVEEADALLIVQPHTGVQVPGKLFEYICVGRPVLAIVPRSSPIETILVNSALPNVCIYPDDPAEVADRKVLEFLRLPNVPTPLNEWFRANFDAKRQTEQLAAIVEQIAAL